MLLFLPWSSRHLRRGAELPVVLEDNHYDFNFQASREPPNETLVLPGDELILECQYDTTAREKGREKEDSGFEQLFAKKCIAFF